MGFWRVVERVGTTLVSTDPEESSGDQPWAPLAAVYESRFSDLRAAARFVTAGSDSVDDLVHEAVVRTFLAGNYRQLSEEHIYRYLLRAIANLARGRARRENVRRRFANLLGEGDEQADRAQTDALDPDLAHSLRLLSRRQRESVVLRYWGGYSVSETALILGVSEGSVKKHCARGLTMLSEHLTSRNGVTDG